MPEIHPSLLLSEEPAATSSHASDTASLTRALVRGDEAAWRKFHDDCHSRLKAYLRAIWIGPEEALDDLAQETLLRAVRNIRVFSDENILWSWLTVLARSAVADAGRKRSRFRRFIERFTGEPNEVVPVISSGLDAAITRLPAATAELIRLKYEEERSISWIAQHLDLSEKAVESRLTRARELLRKEMNRRP